MYPKSKKKHRKHTFPVLFYGRSVLIGLFEKLPYQQLFDFQSIKFLCFYRTIHIVTRALPDRSAIYLARLYLITNQKAIIFSFSFIRAIAFAVVLFSISKRVVR